MSVKTQALEICGCGGQQQVYARPLTAAEVYQIEMQIAFGVLQTLKSNAKKVFLRVRRKTEPTGPGAPGSYFFLN